MSDIQRFGSPTPMMVQYGFDWSKVIDYAKKSVKLLQEQGDTIVDIIQAGFIGIKAITNRDMLGIFAALSDVAVNTQKLIDAIKLEFGL